MLLKNRMCFSLNAWLNLTQSRTTGPRGLLHPGKYVKKAIFKNVSYLIYSKECLEIRVNFHYVCLSDVSDNTCNDLKTKYTLLLVAASIYLDFQGFRGSKVTDKSENGNGFGKVEGKITYGQWNDSCGEGAKFVSGTIRLAHRLVDKYVCLCVCVCVCVYVYVCVCLWGGGGGVSGRSKQENVQWRYVDVVDKYVCVCWLGLG